MTLCVASLVGKLWDAAVRFELVQALHFFLKIFNTLLLRISESPDLPGVGSLVRIVDWLYFATTLFLKVVVMGFGGEWTLCLSFAVRVDAVSVI